jgi:O-antigen/teichoic acid export membrane protein
MFFEQMLRMMTGLLVGVWVARYLGPTQYGLFGYAIAFAALFSSIAKLGLDNIVVRDLVYEPLKRNTLMGTAFYLKLFGAIAMLGVIAVAIQFTTNDAVTNLYIFIIAAGAIFQSVEVVDFYFQSRVLSNIISICKLAQLLISSVIKIYLIVISAGLFWFVLVSLIDQIMLSIALFVAYKRQKLGGFFNHFNWIVARKMLRDSWPLILSGLVIVIYMRIDQVMIKEMLGEKEVGVYTAAVRLSEIWYFIPTLITSSMFPSIINAKKDSNEQYSSRLQKIFTFLVWVSIFIAFLVTLLGNWLVIFLYGVEYQEASQALMIHTWGGVFVALGVASASWYVAENLQRYAFYRTASGAVLNIFLNLVLIPKYGISGAAIATVIAQFMAALFFELLTSKTRVIFKMKIKTLVFAGFLRK